MRGEPKASLAQSLYRLMRIFWPDVGIVNIANIIKSMVWRIGRFQHGLKNQPICIRIGWHRDKLVVSESESIRIKMESIGIDRFRPIPFRFQHNYCQTIANTVASYQLCNIKIWLIDDESALLLNSICLLIWHHKSVVSNLISLSVTRGYNDYSRARENICLLSLKL